MMLKTDFMLSELAVIFQLRKVKGIDVNKQVILQSFCTCGGRCYASAMKTNGLFLVESDGKVEFLTLFPDEGIRINLYIDAVTWGKYIFFVPGAANNFNVYDTEEKTFKVIPVQERYAENYNRNRKFCTAVSYHDVIYFIPETYPAIVKIECESCQITYIDKWVTKEMVCFKKGICCRGDKVIVPSTLSQKYMEFDLRDERVTLKNLPIQDGNSGAWSVCEQDDDYWFVAYPGPAAVRMNADNCFEIHDSFPNGFQNNGYAFAMSFVHETGLYLCPVNSNMLIKVDTESCEMQEIPMENLTGNDMQLMYLCQMNQFLIFCRYNVQKNVYNAERVEQVFLDTEKLKAQVCRFTMINEQDYLHAIMITKMEEKKQIIENKEIGLEDYITLVGNFQNI